MKHCPFCGNFDVVIAERHCFCRNCGARGPEDDQPEKAWQSRVYVQHAPEFDIEKAKAELQVKLLQVDSEAAAGFLVGKYTSVMEKAFRDLQRHVKGES